MLARSTSSLYAAIAPVGTCCTHATDTVSPCAVCRASRRCTRAASQCCSSITSPPAGASVDIREIAYGEAVEVLGGSRRRPRDAAGSPRPRLPSASASFRSTTSNGPVQVEDAVALDLLESEAVLAHEDRLAVVGGDRTETRRGRDHAGPGASGRCSVHDWIVGDPAVRALRPRRRASSASSAPSPQCAGSIIRSNSIDETSSSFEIMIFTAPMIRPVRARRRSRSASSRTGPARSRGPPRPSSLQVVVAGIREAHGVRDADHLEERPGIGGTPDSRGPRSRDPQCGPLGEVSHRAPSSTRLRTRSARIRSLR